MDEGWTVEGIGSLVARAPRDTDWALRSAQATSSYEAIEGNRMTEVGDLREALSTDEAGADLTVRPRTSLSSAARRRTISGLGILSLAVPVIVYLWFIRRYSVNMIWGDTWTDINVVEHAHAGNLSLATLWAQHNESRIFFPNLIVVLLGATTRFNTVIEEYMTRRC